MLHAPRRAFSHLYTPRDLPIRLHGAVRESIVDGPRLRFVIFVQGCPHHCPGCHNPASHDPAGGYVSSTTRLWNAIRENPLLRGVTFSGGEPFLWGDELFEIGLCDIEDILCVLGDSGSGCGLIEGDGGTDVDGNAHSTYGIDGNGCGLTVLLDVALEAYGDLTDSVADSADDNIIA